MHLRCLVVLVGLTLVAPLSADQYPKIGPDIYNIESDAATDIAAALVQAQTAHKRVLLDFGANWCIWCHRLHQLFGANPEIAAQLDRDYVVVMIDANSRKVAPRNVPTITKYHNPTQFGLPVLVVLDADGNLLTTQETGALEDGPAHSPAKVSAFLAKWAAK